MTTISIEEKCKIINRLNTIKLKKEYIKVLIDKHLSFILLLLYNHIKLIILHLL